MRPDTARRRLPPRARSAGPSTARRRNITLKSDCPARAHVWGKQAERSEAVGGSPALGTPETLTDAQGAIHHQKFDPFGARKEGDTTLTRIGFTSHHQDDDIALVDMAGRVYDPLAGRFTTADPILQAPFSSQGQNRYAYVFNDPINKTDPSGFAWQDMGSTGGNVAWGVGAAAWGGAAAYAAGGFTGFSAAGAAVGGASLALGPAVTLGMNPFGGSSSAKYSAPAPSGVVSSSPVKPGGADAVGQSAAPGPAKERSPESYAAGPKNVIPCRTKEICEQIAWEFALGGPFGPGAIVKEGAAGGRVLINLLRSVLPKSAAEILAEKAALIIAKLPASTFRLFECSQCANTIVKALQKAGVSGQTLKVTANHGAEFIVSDLYKGGVTPITQNGRHFAVQVGDTVFDNLNKGGVLRETWEKALHSPFGHTIEAAPF